MPPKPFNPPRPSTSTPSAPKAKGRPKGSTSKAKGSTSTSKNSSGVKKSTKPSAGNGKAKSGNKEGARLSAASIRSLLPSLSPDTSDAETSSVPKDAEEEDSDDPFASQPRPSTSKSRHPSTTNQARTKEEEEEDAHAAGLDERKEHIPDDLLAVVLSRFFRERGGGGTRMSRDAVRAVGRYMDTFVREGVARGAWAGEERGNGVLEVEDLERLAPQLLLDF
ncbi:CENP-S associating centromere protein X-domain-containing protein [Hyaloscypha sp. PMI_1271]|nr:CENP-S associating centromere protein X-domain-containing protein [Hyaloscypha sp. PMI_1271]